MNSIENLPLRTLLRIVHHRRPVDEPRIASVLRLADLSILLRHGLDNLLTRLGLTDRSFATLVALYTLDPEPVTPADLAYHIDSPRSSVTTTLDQLEQSGHVSRIHDAHHHGATRVRLTPPGRELVGQAVAFFLDAADRISRHLPRETCEVVSSLCDVLQAECRSTVTPAHGENPFVP